MSIFDRDTNGDGRLSFDELITPVVPRPKKPKGPLTIPMIGAPIPEGVNADGLTPTEVEEARERGYREAREEAARVAKRGKNSMLSTLQKLGNYSAGNINTSMNNLSTMLQGQKNPYADFKAQYTPTSPDMSQLLQSQGVSQDPLQQFATAINTQNRGQADAFQNQANTMRDIYGANQASTLSNVEAQRSQLLNSLQANTFGTGAALMGKQAPDRNAILQMMLRIMNNGGGQ
jgi:hypothetical protein